MAVQSWAWNKLVLANNNRAVRLRGAFAQASFHDNLVCNVARAQNGGPTQIDFLNNPTAALLPAPQVSTEAGATARMCHSGTAAGAGTVLDDSGG